MAQATAASSSSSRSKDRRRRGRGKVRKRMEEETERERRGEGEREREKSSWLAKRSVTGMTATQGVMQRVSTCHLHHKDRRMVIVMTMMLFKCKLT